MHTYAVQEMNYERKVAGLKTVNKKYTPIPFITVVTGMYIYIIYVRNMNT